MIKSLIITGWGLNCEEETAAAYRLAKAKATTVHLHRLLAGQISIQDYDIINWVGGFSFGDELGAGKALANKIKYTKIKGKGNTLLDEIKIFLKAGKYILGICNGFQLLVKLGLLPNTELGMQQEVSLVQNASFKFENRWIYCKVNPCNPSPFFQDINIIALPVRHGEGRLVLKNKKIAKEITKQKLNALSYCTATGEPTATYPANPNGSALNCAALTNKTGQILGLMPHPEAFLTLYNHPNWQQMKRKNPMVLEIGDGLKLFKNIVNHLEQL